MLFSFSSTNSFSRIQSINRFCSRKRIFSTNPSHDESLLSVTLLKELKDWRRRTADELQQPVYRIMNNQLLENISTQKPYDAIQLSMLPGIGPFKLNKFGPMIVEIVRKYIPARSPESSDAESIDTSGFWIQAKQLKSKSKRKKSSAISEKVRNYSRKPKIETMTEDEMNQMMESQQLFMHDLNIEQQAAASHILSGNNVFVTGSAGTGKTYLIKYVIQELIKEYGEDAVAVTAPTGIAAINIGGQTIHSFSGVGLGNGEKDKLIEKVLKNKSSVERWKQCKVLVIDEISMLDKKLFETVEEVARRVKGTDIVFGDIQIIVVGDFMQLPPVMKDKNEQVFCFESQLWDILGFKEEGGTIHLNTVVRQTDSEFIKYLNQVRIGVLSAEFQARLNSCLVTNKEVPSNGIIPTKLYAINKEVDAENSQRLEELPSEKVVLEAMDKWKIIPTKENMKTFLRTMIQNIIPEKIEMKVGAQVMLLRNRSRMTYGGVVKYTGPSLVNGSRGKIVGFTESIVRPGSMVPTVLFDNGLVTTIGPVEYEYKSPDGDGIIVRMQIPLKLAWAATVHKSQGCTLTCAELMLDKAFDYGQAYVALSRVKNLDSLWLQKPLLSRAVKAHPLVLDFYGYRKLNSLENV